MPPTDRESVATRNILLNWASLSEGDVSTINATLGTEGSCAGTIEGSPHFVFWENLELLGWAERVRPAILQPSASKRPAFFSLTREGRERLPAFIAHYDLKPGTYYIDKARPPADPAIFDRALESAANICLTRDRHPPNLTFDARMKLRILETGSVSLALAAFAYDAKESVSALIAFNEQEKLEELERELLYLRSRIRRNWTFDLVGLPLPAASLHELAAPLGIGLGSELEAWLYDPILSFPRATAWLAQHGPDIDSFYEHVTALASHPPSWE